MDDNEIAVRDESTYRLMDCVIALGMINEIEPSALIKCVICDINEVIKHLAEI